MKEKYYSLKHAYFLYVDDFIRYFSIKKLLNFILNWYEFKSKKTILKSCPSVIHFDVSNTCVLHCPLCATGRRVRSQTKGVMKFDDFKEVFDKFKDKLFFVWLYNWGEPLLCPDLFKIVDYCHKNNVGVRLHSNLNYYNEKILKNLVAYRVDYISLSIDGFSQKNYQFYRRGGNLKKVLDGIKKIQKYKNESNSRYPVLVWQYLINSRNLDEVSQARSFAEENGIDVFGAIPLTLYTDIESRYNKKNYKKFLLGTGVSESDVRNFRYHLPCRYLWCSLVFNPDLSYSPCPAIYKDKHTFGKYTGKEIKSMVNSKVYTESRKLFSIKGYQPKVFTPCGKCNRILSQSWGGEA